MKVCNKCLEEKDLSEFHKSLNKRVNKYYYESSCKECKRLYNKTRKKERYHTDEAFRSLVKEQTSEYSKENKEKYLAYSREWKSLNKSKVRSDKAKRRASKFNATPNWSESKLIESLYEEARKLTEKTGEPHHVDHIVPLINDMVCGLHVYANLQILTASENFQKSNSFANCI